jgi:hypothetical protein
MNPGDHLVVRVRAPPAHLHQTHQHGRALAISRSRSLRSPRRDSLQAALPRHRAQALGRDALAARRAGQRADGVGVEAGSQ